MKYGIKKDKDLLGYITSLKDEEDFEKKRKKKFCTH